MRCFLDVADGGIRDCSLDHFVGACDERRRHLEAERFGGLEIDDEFDLGRHFDRKVGGLGAAQNAIDVASER
jgi:hypothetical protein